MIYELGLRLGTADFTSVAESNEIALQLKYDLMRSTTNCILCLLYAHSKHEERDFFAAVIPFDRDVVELMLADHRDIAKRIIDLAKSCDDLVSLTDPNRRIEAGDRLNLDASDLFAMYLAHLNNEEATMVPIMWEHFSDQQLRELRARFYNQIALPRFEEWMRWTIPALNTQELGVLLKGMRTDPPPNRFQDAMRIAETTLAPDRWASVKSQLGAEGPARS